MRCAERTDTGSEGQTDSRRQGGHDIPPTPPQVMGFGGGKGLRGGIKAGGAGWPPKSYASILFLGHPGHGRDPGRPPKPLGGPPKSQRGPQSMAGMLLTFLQDVLSSVLPLVLIFVLVIHVWRGGSGR